MKNITVDLFKKILDVEKNNSSVEFINVCTPVEYAEKHINGVKSMPLDTLEKSIDLLKNKQTIYVHCRSGKRAEKAIQKMKESGINAEMINVTGGLNAWEEAGFSTHSLSSSRMTLMRQVFLTAGLLVLLGITLSFLTKNMNFLFISAFVGLGLSFSGITGWCGLQLFLSKMPWNKINNKC
jgi:rhodanese-related sulfurtransferase